VTNVGAPAESQLLNRSNGTTGGTFAATAVLSFAGFFFPLLQLMLRVGGQLSSVLLDDGAILIAYSHYVTRPVMMIRWKPQDGLRPPPACGTMAVVRLPRAACAGFQPIRPYA
jgi:hypothetical protein